MEIKREKVLKFYDYDKLEEKYEREINDDYIKTLVIGEAKVINNPFSKTPKYLIVEIEEDGISQIGYFLEDMPLNLEVELDYIGKLESYVNISKKIVDYLLTHCLISEIEL